MKKEEKKTIDWTAFTTEEINLKKIELNNTYQNLRKLSLDVIEQMERIEIEFNEANKELNNRGF